MAELIVDSLKHHSPERYALHACVVMSKHVHAVLHPNLELARILQTLKSYTGRRANALLGRTGQPFWQAESFDHRIRNEQHFRKIREYVENNPVPAGLVARPEDYRWSSAWDRRTEPR